MFDVSVIIGVESEILLSSSGKPEWLFGGALRSDSGNIKQESLILSYRYNLLTKY